MCLNGLFVQTLAKKENRLKILLFISLLSIFVQFAHAKDFHVHENKDVKILFENLLEPAAKEVAEIYPGIRASLERDFGWELSLKPSVLLIRDSKHFLRMGAHPLTVGFAIPKSSMIVIDYTKMARHPFTIQNTLKHEMCHLLLHHHIREHPIPRWLDEGVCQWASDGLADILVDQKRALLHRAALRGIFIPLDSLDRGFPTDNDGLMLAYEESKSFLTYIISTNGREGVLRILNHMKNGERVEQAFLKALSISLYDLELEWRDSLRKGTIWFLHLSYYLYEIIFGLLALLSIFAFIKIILKKRAYMAEDPDDSLPS